MPFEQTRTAGGRMGERRRGPTAGTRRGRGSSFALALALVPLWARVRASAPISRQLSCALLTLGAATAAGAQEPPSLDAALRRFWAAPTPARAEALVPQVLRTGASFDTLFARLRAGPAYGADVSRGSIERERVADDGVVYRYVVLVPEAYDPARRYPVVFYLHGGVNRPEWPSGGGWWNRPERLAREDRIAVFPASWRDAMWWHANQTANLAAILHELKRDYNVDEDRAYVLGYSDGGTGAYFLAFRDGWRWAAFVALLAHPSVLANPTLRVDGDMFPVNLSNRPLLVINGERDPLYPWASMPPYLALFRRAGAVIDARSVDGGHDLGWWPSEAERVNAFLDGSRREPHPARIVWETERPAHDGRFGWLRISQLGRITGEAEREDFNRLVGGDRDGRLAFPRRRPSGRVVARRDGNTIVLETWGVRRVGLLLSPDVFDLDRPITVVANGRTLIERVVPRSTATLLTWAARDRDRGVLYAAELLLSLEG